MSGFAIQRSSLRVIRHLRSGTWSKQNVIRLCSTASSPASGGVKPRLLPASGPGLEHFIANGPDADAGLRRAPQAKDRRAAGIRRTPTEVHPYLTPDLMRGDGRKVYFDVHGCQMNVSDTEVIWSILSSSGYEMTSERREADVWLIVTCSIRDGAEQKIWNKLSAIKGNKSRGSLRRGLTVGLLGCMAERLKDRLLQDDRLVDVVAGPDAYRDLPRLLAVTRSGASQSAINVVLSMEETYAEVAPLRLNQDKVTGFVSIQRGCDNMCSYCIVPFTRGRERSRPLATVVEEVRALAGVGVKEVTLLGQNVNSYRDTSERSVGGSVDGSVDGGVGGSVGGSVGGGETTTTTTHNTTGFKTIYKPKVGGRRFADLLEKVSEVDPELRIRFTSPHPKDFPDEVLQLIAERTNICNHIHMPAQSGSSKILSAMRRGYTREAYLDLVEHVRMVLPGATLSSDFIVGFCGETDADFDETMSLVEQVGYHKIFLFPYSLREKTHAHRQLSDDVPPAVKRDRAQRLDELYRRAAKSLNEAFVGSEQVVLVEGDSKRSDEDLQGRTDGNVKVILPKSADPLLLPGDYCVARITQASALVLKGLPLRKTTLLAEAATTDQPLRISAA